MYGSAESRSPAEIQRLAQCHHYRICRLSCAAPDVQLASRDSISDVTGDEWARTSVVVLDSSGEAVHTLDMPGPTLTEQLQAAEVWLTEHRHDLSGEGTEGQIRLFVSWTPADGRHAMTLPPTLISALADVGGVFWMDVYPEDD